MKRELNTKNWKNILLEIRKSKEAVNNEKDGIDAAVAYF